MREGHLTGELVGPEEPELVDVVGRARFPFCPHEPGLPEDELVAVGLEMRPEPLAGDDLEARLLAELSCETGNRFLALGEEAAWKIPVAEARLDRASREQDLPVALQQPLDRGRRVRVVDRPARRTLGAAGRKLEVGAAARTEPPAVEHAH